MAEGKIDDVGIWSTALTSGQMAAIFNAGQAGKDLTQADAYQNAAPAITTQPLSATRFAGETVVFSVQAAGTAPLYYQWELNGKAIPGATNSTYNLGNVQDTDAGQYIVVVSNAGGSKESQPATLTVQKVSLATGLIAYWKFDEKQGVTAADAANTNGNGTLNNYPGDDSQWVTGQIGGAVEFGGSDAQQFVLVPDYPKPSATITVSAWVWMEELGTWSSFVKNWGSTDAGQFHFGIGGDGLHENIYIKQADGKTPNTSDTTTFPTQTWQHVAFVCDGSKVRLYRNGAEVASTNYNGTLVTPPMNCIGIGVKIANDCSAPDSGAAGWLHGKMDDVAIWNRGLSANEILAIYQAGSKGVGALEADTAQVIAPSITTAPAGGTVFEGVLVSLKVEAIGTPPLAYQWFKDGQAVLNATNNTLDLGAANASIAGSYKVSVTNTAGQVTSDEVSVAVQKRPPAILFCEWKFDDNLKDTSGQGNDGTASGTVQYVPGISGKAVRLAPGNPIVNDAAQNLPGLGSNSWSLNLWMNLTEEPKSLAYLAGFGPVMDRGAGTARALLAFMGPRNNNLYIWGSNRDTPSDTAYPVGRWAMVTITFDGADGTASLYLDGQLIAQNVQPRADIPDGENRISLAATSNWGIDTGGDFDEFTIWNGVLNGDQIGSLFAAGSAVTVTAVPLSIVRSGSQLRISWPATVTGYILESTDKLPAASWSAVTGVQTNSAGIDFGTGTRFYRLRKP